MLWKFAAAIVFLGAAAPAQVTTSSQEGNAPELQGDADKIVCQKVEKIGSRLGAKKVCLTVREWRERKTADRDETARIQSGAPAERSN